MVNFNCTPNSVISVNEPTVRQTVYEVEMNQPNKNYSGLCNNRMRNRHDFALLLENIVNSLYKRYDK